MDTSTVQDIELREQDRWLPIANVARLMKNTLPATAKVSKDAKECMQECVSEFISFITSEASDKCLREKRKTINGEDILYSMHDLGFENYAEVLKIYLAKFREQQALRQERGEIRQTKRQAKAAALAAAASNSDSASQPSESPIQDGEFASNSEYSNQDYLDQEHQNLNGHMLNGHQKLPKPHELNGHNDINHVDINNDQVHLSENIHLENEVHIDSNDGVDVDENNVSNNESGSIPTPEPFLYNDVKQEHKDDYRYDDFITDSSHNADVPLDELTYTL